MNDEIKQAAEKYKREMWGDHGLVPSDALIKSFQAGASYATEKCQEEIKRLKEERFTILEFIEGINHPTIEAEVGKVSIIQMWNSGFRVARLPELILKGIVCYREKKSGLNQGASK